MGQMKDETKKEYAIRMRHYRENTPEYQDYLRERQRRVIREKKALLVEYKGGTCVDCSGIFPNCCFQFDHREPEEKSFTICCRMYRPIGELKAESDKCDLVCSNCHAVRTFANGKLAVKLRRVWKSKRE
jgi:hypothetical protein